MEFGAKIAVTGKMRGFLKWAFGWTVRKSTITIPPRPFMRPALENTKNRFAALFANLPLGGPSA